MLLWQIGAEWEESRNRGSNILVQKSKKCSYKSSMDEKKFYIFFNGETQGPFSERGLEMLCSQKRITGVTLICSKDDAKWIPYSDFLKNRPVTVEEKSAAVPIVGTPKAIERRESKKSFKIGMGLDEEKVPFSSLTIAVFSIVGGVIIIFSMFGAALFLLSTDSVPFALVTRLIITLGIFVSGVLSGGILIALASLMQCQLRSVDLLKKIVEQTKK